MTLSINRTPILNVTSLLSLRLFHGFRGQIALLGRITSERALGSTRKPFGRLSPWQEGVETGDALSPQRYPLDRPESLGVLTPVRFLCLPPGQSSSFLGRLPSKWSEMVCQTEYVRVSVDTCSRVW